MITWANGFVALHLEVRVAPGQVDTVQAAVKQWQPECREQAGWPGFPGTLMQMLRALPEVTDVVIEGPQSSLLIPLRMHRGLSDTRACLSTRLGTGPITDTIERAAGEWGIELDDATRIEDADSPVELSFRDGNGSSASLILYPAPRIRYRPPTVDTKTLPDRLLVNRVNKGLLNLAARVDSNGGLVSFRPRELGRFDDINDYVAMLPFVTHLVVSSRHGVLKALAGNAGIQSCRGWPNNLTSLNDPDVLKLARWLGLRMRPDAVVILHRHADAESIFWRAGAEPVVVTSPEGYDLDSRAARIQGALLGLTGLTQQHLGQPIPTDRWEAFCKTTIQLAWNGTDGRPWQYPTVEQANTLSRTLGLY